MAIKVAGTTVIDDSRNISNIPTITTLRIAETAPASVNTSTALTIDLATGTVFRVTLNNNATITFSNASLGSAVTVILTNGFASNTVTWAYSGGTFRYPSGASNLSRTTTANAVDIWTFFTPDGGTNWYGNIALKNLAT
jgi:hypothetical protein